MQILCNIPDLNPTIADTRLQFLFSIIRQLLASDQSALSLLPEDMEDSKFSVDARIQFKNLLFKYNIHLREYPDGAFQIFLNKELIAEWQKPWIQYCKDESEIDPKRQLFAKVNLKIYSIFNEASDIEEDNEENNS